MNTRKWLSSDELKKVLDWAKKRSVRDYCLFLLSYRHGLRASEAINLKWTDWDVSKIFIHRLKGSISTTHPLASDEVKLLRKLSKQSTSDFIFESRNGGAITESRLRQLSKLCRDETGVKFNFHRLRHTCGYDLACKGIDSLIIKDYLGHKNIQNTMIYVASAGQRFNQLGQWYKK